MNLIPRRLTLFALALLVISFTAFTVEAAAQDLTEADRLFLFAGQLMEEEDYYRAITEYKRFLSYFPKDARVSLCNLSIARAYRKGERTDLAIAHLEQILNEQPREGIAERASFEIGLSYFLSRRYEEAARALSAFIEGFPLSGRLDPARALLGWCQVNLWELERAADTFFVISETSGYYSFAGAVAKEIQSGVVIPRKSPAVAGFLSAILPGAGQAYTGRWNEAFTSFLLNGAFIWAAAELFSDGSDAAGGLVSFIEGGWYTGGIFGAVNNAHKFNRRAKQGFIEALQSRYPLPPVD